MALTVTGRQLIRMLVQEAGYTVVRRTPHGLWLEKIEAGRTRHTTVKDTNELVRDRTLAAILGPQQTGLGRDWLQEQLTKRKRRGRH